MPLELNTPIRILAVDDHEPFRHFVCSKLRGETNLQVIGEAEDRLTAVQLAEALQPDTLPLDIGLPQLNGIEAARQIRRVACDARIIFLTQEASPEVAQEALGLWGHGATSLRPRPELNFWSP